MLHSQFFIQKGLKEEGEPQLGGRPYPSGTLLQSSPFYHFHGDRGTLFPSPTHPVKDRNADGGSRTHKSRCWPRRGLSPLRIPIPPHRQMCKHTVGFEPTDTGFAAQRLEPLGDVCEKWARRLELNQWKQAYETCLKPLLSAMLNAGGGI